MRTRAVVVFAILLACCTSRPVVEGGHPAESGPFHLPAVKHVFVVVLENEDESLAALQPFMQQLATKGALLRRFHAITHPSQPNYIALTSGSTHSVRTDLQVNLDVRHLGDLLEAKHLEWKSYAENYPGNCYLGMHAQGKFVRRHVPFLSYLDVQKDPQRCARVVNARQFDADFAAGLLPSFSLYVPNNDHNGHDTGVAVADRWLRDRFEKLLADPLFMDGTLFVVTFDEGRNDDENRIYTVLVGEMVKPGVVSDVEYDHYSLLRTIEETLGVGTLGKEDERRRPIEGVWRAM